MPGHKGGGHKNIQAILRLTELCRNSALITRGAIENAIRAVVPAKETIRSRPFHDEVPAATCTD